MKLTEQQAMEAIDSLRASDEGKEALRQQWRRGEPSAKFAVFNIWKRNQ